ncbi:MAG: hypothetical protein WCW13_00545 [archaeon]|jgi:hypothetical protein
MANKILISLFLLFFSSLVLADLCTGYSSVDITEPVFSQTPAVSTGVVGAPVCPSCLGTNAFFDFPKKYLTTDPNNRIFGLSNVDETNLARYFVPVNSSVIPFVKSIDQFRVVSGRLFDPTIDWDSTKLYFYDGAGYTNPISNVDSNVNVFIYFGASGTRTASSPSIVASGGCMSGVVNLWGHENFSNGGTFCLGDTTFHTSFNPLPSATTLVSCPSGTTKMSMFKISNSFYGGEGAICVQPSGSAIVASGVCMSGAVNLWDNQIALTGGASCIGDTTFHQSFDPIPGASPTVSCPAGTTKLIVSKVTNSFYGGEGAICVSGGNSDIVATGVCMSGMAGMWDAENIITGGAYCAGDISFHASTSTPNPEGLAKVTCPTGTIKKVVYELQNNFYGGEGAICVSGGFGNISLPSGGYLRGESINVLNITIPTDVYAILSPNITKSAVNITNGLWRKTTVGQEVIASCRNNQRDYLYLDFNGAVRKINITFSDGARYNSCNLLREIVAGSLNTSCANSNYASIGDIDKDLDVDTVDLGIIQNLFDQTICSNYLANTSTPCPDLTDPNAPYSCSGTVGTLLADTIISDPVTHIKPGWNLVSFPTLTSVKASDLQMCKNFTYIADLDNQTGKYVGIDPYFSNAFLNNNKAYWIYSEGYCDIPLNKYGVASKINLTLYNGFNLIPGIKISNWFTLGKRSSLSTWVPTLDGKSGSYNNVTSPNSTMGFWVNWQNDVRACN